MPKSAADVVAVWFAQNMATGPLSRDDAAHAQAIAARDDLIKRLASAKGDAAAAVNAWFAEQIAAGAIARNTAAYNQAFAAKGVLIGALSGDDAPANAVRPAAKPLTPKAKAKPAAPAAPPTQSAAPAKAEPETQA